MKSRTLLWVVWAVRILLVLGFLAAGSGKLTMNPVVLEMFADWGYPPAFCFFIGVVETAGAILILVPATSRYATIGLLIVMAGAIITHLINDPPLEVVRPVIFSVFLTINLILTAKVGKLKMDSMQQ